MGPLIPITLFMCIAAVLILRPVTKRLGGLLEALTRDRARRVQENADARTIALLEQVSRRLDLVEERLDFTERLVSTRKPELRRPPQHSSLSVPELDAEYLPR